MSKSKSALIVGASSGVGRSLAGQLAEAGFDLLLIARDQIDLEAVANDCRLRFGVQAWTKPIDLASPLSNTQQMKDWINQTTKSIRYAFLTAGANADEDVGPPPEGITNSLVQVNFLSLAHISSFLASNAKSLGLRSLIVCSSIAAAAPRRRNIAYAAAKAALETFSLGLRHFLADQGVRVQIYKLGYVDSGLSFGQRLLLPKATPEAVARRMIRDVERDFGIRYFPFYWRWIVAVLRLLPWSMYKRLSF